MIGFFEVYVFLLISVYCYIVGKRLIFFINILYMNLFCCNFNLLLFFVLFNTRICICIVRFMLVKLFFIYLIVEKYYKIIIL